MAVSSRDGALRRLEPHWNHELIIAAIALCLLGAFTSAQLMCQARVSLRFSSVLIWTLLASLTFGFASIWSLHFVAMLAYELDIQIGINVPLTLLSSVLAVAFTFTALASDLLWDSYCRERTGNNRNIKKKKATKSLNVRQLEIGQEQDSRPLLSSTEDEEYVTPPLDSAAMDHFFSHRDSIEADENAPFGTNGQPDSHGPISGALTRFTGRKKMLTGSSHLAPLQGRTSDPTEHSESTTGQTESSESGTPRPSSQFTGSSSTSSYHLSSIMNIAYRSTSPAKNAFVTTGEALYHGCTRKNIAKGFLWSLAITSMHYAGIFALRIPTGHCTLNPVLVVMSALISWIVCVVGCILMSQMETHLSQQFLFSVVATAGVASMHFTGMRAATFWSRSPPTEARGYPPSLAIAIVSIAIATCLAANGLLAHAATISRNKLAEIVWTRKKLWRAIAQKENAEAAALARSDFIASASHEIRTPLHHLTGYSDLLSQTELTEEGRALLCAIQRATKTLSLITNNVLDWSKLERDAETVCRPVALDIRTVCESILILLPNKDDEAEVELMVVVKPDVPKSIFLDETYINRVLMNLISNALKFTRSGYILLLIEIVDGKLVAMVKDTGSGVPPSFLPQLFEPFKQAQTRGSQRGTGLGLSIVKQLLHKMGGEIAVESSHPETGEVDPNHSGSTFTISIPVQSSMVVDEPVRKVVPKIAIFHGGNSRAVEGLQIAWEKYGFDAVVVHEFADLSGTDWQYIWTDLQYLKQSPACLQGLLSQDKWLVLVPYDTQHTLQQIPELASSPQIIGLSRPLLWHTIPQRIAAAKQHSTAAELSRVVRFASKVDIRDQNDQVQAQEPTAKNACILLVEDNPINQKLGKKMLTSLGYSVLIAEHGQDAVDQTIAEDSVIDAILMDQSMPVKDGVTATKEIRELEAAGKLSRRHPVIAVTAVVNTQAQALFKAAGADDFLAKPLSLGKLRHTLDIHLPVKRR